MIPRRQFITLLGGAVAVWPLAARAQQAAMPVIGFLGGETSGDFARFVAAFHGGLNEAGYVEGKNVRTEYRWAEHQYDRLPELAADLVQSRVTVIAAGDNVSALAAKTATTTIPILFRTGSDPVTLGLVASFNRPGGNITGVGFFGSQLGAKRLQILHEIAPKASRIAMLGDPGTPSNATQIGEAQDAAHEMGLDLVVLTATTEHEVDAAFAAFAQQHTGAVLIASSPFLGSRTAQMVALAARYALPTMSPTREYATTGGLLSYGTDFADSVRQMGLYTGQILKGAKPAEMPILQTTKFEFVVNLKTAKALGLTVPASLIAIADEVIE
jgi:putative ABC transport system substrate-binding protein